MIFFFFFFLLLTVLITHIANDVCEWVLLFNFWLLTDYK